MAKLAGKLRARVNGEVLFCNFCCITQQENASIIRVGIVNLNHINVPYYRRIGVPVKEVSDPATLWCGTDLDDAMTSCHKACPGETNEECPAGMSCFSGSPCTTEGEAVVREGYRCGTTWDDASLNCGLECQGNSDCNEDNGEECFADVVCESELKANMTEGMYCGETWESTSLSCTQSCEVDDDCPANQW